MKLPIQKDPGMCHQCDNKIPKLSILKSKMVDKNFVWRGEREGNARCKTYMENPLETVQVKFFGLQLFLYVIMKLNGVFFCNF